MRSGRVRPPSPATVIALVALFAALGGTGYAVVNGNRIPDSRGAFHGCVDRRTGALRVVAGPTDCRKPRGKGKHRTLGEFAISWSQTGPRGPAGAPGQNGQNGTNGTNGANGQNGTAVAYAAVDSSGNVDASNSKNIAQSDVSHTVPGSFCFANPGFTPHAIDVTAHDAPSGAEVIGPPVTSSQWVSACGSTAHTTDAFIVVMSSNSAGFFLTVN
jgi:hypothetical protein